MSKAPSDQSLSLSAAGRKFELGMVYDAYTHQLFKSIKLLDKYPKGGKNSILCPSISLDFKSSYTINDRMKHFRFDAHMKVSACFGLIALGEASAKYINGTSSSIGQASMTLQYKETKRYEELDMATVKQLSGNHEVLKSAKEIGATHFVAGMTYGNQVLLDFRLTKRNEKEHGLLDIQLKGLIRVLGQSFANKFNKDNTLTTNSEDIECDLFCECKSLKKPASFKEAIQMYQNLPMTLKDEEAVDSVYLLPLSVIYKKARKFKQSDIDEVAMIKLVHIRDDLNEQEMQCNAMEKRGMNTSKIRDQIQNYTKELKGTLSSTSVKSWNKQMVDKNSGMIHELQKSTKKTFQEIAARTCSRCKKELSSEEELPKHIMDHEARTCRRCKKELSTLSELDEHRRDHEARTCNRCKKELSTLSELDEHRRDHEARTCNRCKKELSTLSELDEHRRDHEARTCRKCQKELSTPSELDEHMRDHEARTCPMCVRELSTQSELIQHMRDHEDTPQDVNVGGVAAGAAAGAIAGGVLGPIGAVLGAVIGGGVAAIKDITK